MIKPMIHVIFKGEEGAFIVFILFIWRDVVHYIIFVLVTIEKLTIEFLGCLVLSFIYDLCEKL